MIYKYIQRSQSDFYLAIASIFSLRFDVEFPFSPRLSLPISPVLMFFRLFLPHANSQTSLKHFVFAFSSRFHNFLFFRLIRERSASKVLESGLTLSVFMRACCVHILDLRVSCSVVARFSLCFQQTTTHLSHSSVIGLHWINHPNSPKSQQHIKLVPRTRHHHQLWYYFSDCWLT